MGDLVLSRFNPLLILNESYIYLIDMKMAVFCDAEPCDLVGSDRRFRGIHYCHHKGDAGDSKHL
jgi:hypothetical protein